MSLYIYEKSPEPTSPSKPVKSGSLLPVACAGLGFFIIGILVGSFVLYQWRAEAYFRPSQLEAGEVMGSNVDGSAGENLYLRPAAWFSSAPSLPPQESGITHYNISVPALKIERAVVEIGGQNLDRSMIHYSGTALPGRTGNTVIFCHSVLPQFFNPKNYKAICSTLHTLSLGEEIEIFFDGIRYHYQIVEMFEVEADEISVLGQNFEGEYLSLITCAPPGTYLRRLVVRARLTS